MQVDLERLGVAIVTAFELGEHAVVVDLVHALNAFAMPTVPLLLIGAISAHELGDDVEALRWYDAGSSAIADETDRDTLALQDRAHAWVHEGRWSRATRDRLREQAEQWFPKRPSERIGQVRINDVPNHITPERASALGQEIRTARVQAKAEYDQLQTIKKPLELFVARGGLSDPLVAAREEIAALARQLLDKVGSVEDPKDDHDVDLALATLAEPIHCHPNRPLSDPDNIVAQGADAYVMGYRLLARAVTAVPKLARTLGLSPEQLAALEGTARDNFSAAIDRIDDVRNNSVAVSDVYDSRLFREYPELSGKKLLDVVKAAIPIIERDGEHQTLVICSPGASRNLDDALESLGRLATDIEDGKSPRLHRSYERHGKMTDTKAARTWLFDEGSLARLLDRMMRAATNDKSGWIAG